MIFMKIRSRRVVNTLKDTDGLAAVARSEDDLISHNFDFDPAAVLLSSLSYLTSSRIEPRTWEGILDQAEQSSFYPFSLFWVKPEVFSVT